VKQGPCRFQRAASLHAHLALLLLGVSCVMRVILKHSLHRLDVSRIERQEEAVYLEILQS